MIEKFYLKALPKMETELSLIKAMIDVALYEQTIATSPNETVVRIAENIVREKVLEIEKVLKNPSKYDKKNSHDDLID